MPATAAFTRSPPPPEVKKPGHIPQEKVDEFFKQGYTVVEDFFRPAELEPCKEAISRMVDETANKLHAAGKIPDLHEDADVFTRLTLLEKDFPGANVILFKTQKLPPEFISLWTNPRMLDCCEQFLGPDVACHPVWNLRTKTPHSKLLDIPWHQDSAYFDEKSYEHLVLTAWIPFLDATPENGCMQMVKDGHASGRVARHTCCAGPSWYVMLEEEDMAQDLGCSLPEDVTTVPVPYGGMLLFSNIIPHRSLQNRSSSIRWSVDLRWQSPHNDWGFYDIQPGVVVREEGQEVEEPDWETYLKVNRKEEWQKRYCTKVGGDPEDPFDVTITGPWIGRWEIVHHNTHTEAFSKSFAGPEDPITT